MENLQRCTSVSDCTREAGIPEQSVAIPARCVPKVNSNRFEITRVVLHSKRSSFGELGLNPMSDSEKNARIERKARDTGFRYAFHPANNSNASAIKRILKREKEGEREKKGRGRLKDGGDPSRTLSLARENVARGCYARSNFTKGPSQTRGASIVFKVGQHRPIIPVVDGGGRVNIFTERLT